MLRRIRNLIAPFSCGTIRAKKKHSKADKEEEETNQEIELEKQQKSQLETQNDLERQPDIKSENENNQDILDADSSSSGESLTTIINKYRGLQGLD